jgi:hypothetical protein
VQLFIDYIAHVGHQALAAVTLVVDVSLGVWHPLAGLAFGTRRRPNNPAPTPRYR